MTTTAHHTPALFLDDGLDWASAGPPDTTGGLALCSGCSGPVDPFTTQEAGLVLHRTIRIDVDAVDWQKTRMSANDRYPTVKIGRKQVQPEKVKRTKWWKAKAAKAAANVPMVDWARIVVFYRFPNNIRRDVGNLQPTSKAIVDGLVEAGVVPDDNDKHVLGPDNRREQLNGPHQVIVRIYRRA